MQRRRPVSSSCIKARRMPTRMLIIQQPFTPAKDSEALRQSHLPIFFASPSL